MKITQISAWQVDLPLKEGRYNWSNGNSVSVFDSTVVEIKTDEGLYGYAECCPLGSAYLPSFARGVRAGLAELAPHLIGCDPANIQQINQVMDDALRGHPYAKAPDRYCLLGYIGQAFGSSGLHPSWRRNAGRRSAIPCNFTGKPFADGGKNFWL